MEPLPSFDELASTCFDAIRQYGRSSVPVCAHLADTFGVLAGRVETLEQLTAVRRQTRLVDEAAGVGLAVESDRAFVHQRALHTLALLDRRQGWLSTQVEPSR